MGIAFIVCLLILFCLAFDLGRKWERMEWDGSFDNASRPTTGAVDLLDSSRLNDCEINPKNLPGKYADEPANH